MKTQKETLDLLLNISQLNQIDDNQKGDLEVNVKDLIKNQKKIQKIIKQLFELWKAKPRSYYNMRKSMLH